MRYQFLRALMRFVARTYLVGLFRVEGFENVPLTGPLLVCPNHPSTIDPPLVPAFLPRSDSWSMGKSEYFARPGATKLIFESYNAFPVVRHSPDRKAIRRAFEILGAGHVLILYPEGHRVESGLLEVPEPGAGFIAQRSRAPILPVAATGTAECLPKGAWWPRRVPVTIKLGKPFCVRDRYPDGSRVPAALAADAIMVRIAEMLPAEVRGRYKDLEAARERVAGVYE